MAKRRLFLATGLLLCVGFTRTVQADSVNVRFTVTVTTAHGPLETFFGSSIASGDVLHGSLVYDPVGSTGSAGDFRPPGTLTIGARNDVELPLQDVMIFDDRQDAVPDGHDGFGTSGLSLTTPGFARVESVLELNSPMAGRGSDLPRTTAELLARFQSGPFSFMAFRPGDSDDASQHLFGFATVAKAAETPEPTTLFLLGTGACALIKQPRRAKI